jgi:FkbM family methyltransferase
MDKIHDTQILGHSFRFSDLGSSSIVPYVASELGRDVYRLGSIQLEPDDVFMDIGANVGMTSILVNRMFGCKVVAIEPVPGNFANMEKNLELNNYDLSKFTLINAAAASRSGQVDIGVCDYSTGNNSQYDRIAFDRKVSCPMVVVRDLLVAHRPKYLKIDCEGAEWDIIPSLDADCLSSVRWIGLELHTVPGKGVPESLIDRLRSVFTGEIIKA